MTYDSINTNTSGHVFGSKTGEVPGVWGKTGSSPGATVDGREGSVWDGVGRSQGRWGRGLPRERGVVVDLEEVGGRFRGKDQGCHPGP